MIPDKIYIPKNLAPHLTEEWASHTHGSLDEYIRKDTLLEWLRPSVNLIAEGYHPQWVEGRNFLREQLLDKINSL